jgi:hypothetical protein
MYTPEFFPLVSSIPRFGNVLWLLIDSLNNPTTLSIFTDKLLDSRVYAIAKRAVGAQMREWEKRISG